MENFVALTEYYGQAHKHPINKILHLIGIPCVFFSCLIFFSWIHLIMPGIFDVHTSWLMCASLLIYYAQFDRQYALLLGAILLPFIFLANLIASYWFSFPIFCILFAAGWILQLIGHLIEEEQPSCLKKPKILLLMPLILLAEKISEQSFRSDLNSFN